MNTQEKPKEDGNTNKMASKEEELLIKRATSSNTRESKESFSQLTPSKLTTITDTSTVTQPSLENPSAEEDREFFGNGIEFVLTTLGLAVGLGNVWRFPTRAYENGGSAFLIPYLTCAFLFGFPAVYFEFLTGQYNGKSPPIIFRRIMPFLEGVGWMGVAAAILISMYYIVIVSWILLYMFNIIRGDFNIWNKCDNSWNVAATCIDMLRQKECQGNNETVKMIFINGTCQDASLFDGVEILGATEQYFMKHVIRPSDGLFDFGGFNWPVFVSMTVCWILTALGIIKGTKIMGKISYVSVLLPYFIVIVLFIRGVTLPGAYEGLYYYLGQPDYSKLFLIKTWTEALIQLAFSLSVGNGGLISLSSCSPKHNNVFRDALIVIIGDTLMSLIGGAAVFSTLGFLAKQRGVKIPEVIKSGLSLAFVVYPEAITQMPIPWLWSFLFFFMLFLLGASTEIALVDGICACIYDQNRGSRNKKWMVVLGWCFVLYASGLIFCTNAGLYWFELFDEYAAGFSSVCAVVAQLLAMMYVYGFRNVRDDITEMLGKSKNVCGKALGPNSWWYTVNWMVISPLLAAVLMVLSLIRDYPFMGKPDVYPLFFDIFGWFLAFLPVLVVPLYMVVNYVRFRNRGYTARSVFMLQKQHVSYKRISKRYSEEKLALQDQLPEKEPWDEEEENEENSF